MRIYCLVFGTKNLWCLMNLRKQLNHCLKIGLLLLVFVLPSIMSPAFALKLANIKLPPGFKIELYCENIPTARQMVLSPKGILFVGTLEQSGKVYAVIDENKDGKADKVVTIAKNLFCPNGVAFRNGSLYVA